MTTTETRHLTARYTTYRMRSISGLDIAVFGIERQARIVNSYVYEDSLYNTSAILNGARCVVDDAYS